MPQPLVEGGVLGMGGEIALIHQPHRIARHPQRRLHTDPDVAQLHAAQQITARQGAQRALAQRAPPLLDAGRVQRPQPLAQGLHRHAGAGPVLEALALRDATHPGVIGLLHPADQFLAAVRQRAEAVALRRHRPQQRHQRIGHLQQGGGAGGAIAGRKAIEHDRHAALGSGLAAQADPAVEAPGEPFEALGDQVDAIAHQPSQRHRINGAVELRQGEQHDALQAADAVAGPGVQVLDQQRRRHHIGHVLGPQDALGHLFAPARLHRTGRAAHQREADRRDDRIHRHRLAASAAGLPLSRQLTGAGHPVAHGHVPLHAVDEHRQRHQPGSREGTDQLGDVGLSGDHMLAVEQQPHHRPVLLRRRAFRLVTREPGHVVAGRPEEAVMVGMAEAEIGRVAQRGDRDGPEPQPMTGQVEEQGGDVVAAAGIPVAVENQPVAQILGSPRGQEAQQFRPHLEEAEIGRQPVLFTAAAELGQQRLNRPGHAGAAAADAEATETGELHQLDRRLEHQPDRDPGRMQAQPLHLIEIKDQTGEEGIGLRQRSGHRVGTVDQIAIAEHADLQVRTLGHRPLSGLAIESGVERLETSQKQDAFHERRLSHRQGSS